MKPLNVPPWRGSEASSVCPLIPPSVSDKARSKKQRLICGATFNVAFTSLDRKLAPLAVGVHVHAPRHSPLQSREERRGPLRRKEVQHQRDRVSFLLATLTFDSPAAWSERLFVPINRRSGGRPTTATAHRIHETKRPCAIESAQLYRGTVSLSLATAACERPTSGKSGLPLPPRRGDKEATATA